MKLFDNFFGLGGTLEASGGGPGARRGTLEASEGTLIRLRRNYNF